MIYLSFYIIGFLSFLSLYSTGNPEFFEPPSCPFYKYSSGWNTPYGQQTVAFLSVGATTGDFQPTVIEQTYWATYNPAGSNGSINHWYYDASTKEFVSNEQQGNHYPICGGNDNQADALVHQIPLTALYAGNTSLLLQKVDAAIRVTQNTDDAVAFGMAGSRILEYVLLYNVTGYEAVNYALLDMQNSNRAQPYPEDADLAAGMLSALQAINVSNMDYCLLIGQSCDYPHNLFTGSHLIAQLGNTLNDYINGTRQTIMAGGDNGSRGFFVGAIQAALIGDVTQLPTTWASKMDVFNTVLTYANQLVNYRSMVQKNI